MNRQVKFRARDLNTNEWIYGDLLNMKDKKFIHDSSNDLIEVKPDTIEQFTGLVDVDNKEIYEGDILQLTYAEISRGIVMWCDKMSAFGIKFWWSDKPEGNTLGQLISDSDYTMKIIGNIQDNPELLNVIDKI